MKLEEKKIIYDETFSATKSNDNTLKIYNDKYVATNKHYHAIGNPKVYEGLFTQFL